MKRIVLSLFVVISIVLLSCGRENKEASLNGGKDNGTAEMNFSKLEHDFGKITEGEKVACMFNFINSGDGDLLISSATTSCGCTVPRFSKEPIPPGETGSIEVLFDSAYREGTQTKTVTIRSNAKPKIMILRIVADVLKSES